DRTRAWKTIQERACDVDAFVAVSKYHADLMRERAGLPADRVHVVHNGINLEGYNSGPRGPMPDPPVLGFLARMCWSKGLQTLVEAYIALRKRDRVKNLRLRVAGTRTEADVP